MKVRCSLLNNCWLIQIILIEHIHQIVKGFSNDWKKSLDLINQDIMRTFTNFKNGTAILQVRYSFAIHKGTNLCYTPGSIDAVGTILSPIH